MRLPIQLIVLICMLLASFAKDAIAKGPPYQSLFKHTDTLPVFDDNYLPLALEAKELRARTENLPLRASDVELFRLRYRNESKDTIKGYLLLPYNEFTLVYNPQQNHHFHTGSHIERKQRALPDHGNLIPLTIPPSEVYEYQVITGNFSGRSLALAPLSFMSSPYYYERQLKEIGDLNNPIALDFIFLGAIGIFMLYTLILYFQNRSEWLYLYYAIYMLATLLYMLPKFVHGSFISEIFGLQRWFYLYLNEPIQMVIFLFYNFFVMAFLNLKKHSLRHYYTFQVLNAIYIAYLIFVIIYELISGEVVLLDHLFVISRLGIFILGLYLILDIWISYRHPLKKYIVFGSLCFSIGTMLAMYYSVFLETIPPGGFFPVSFMKMGIIAEVLFFSLGLGHKIRLVSKERDQAQQDYIEQLKRNEKLNLETKRGLEEQVAERTAQIIKKTKELELEKEAKIKALYDQKLMRSEMNSLRLQMNPHFIFNSLNSIRHLVLKKDWQKASSYITGFSKLLRLILQNSKKSTVPLEDDLAALEIYLRFEQQRFDNKFGYSLNLDPKIDAQSVEIQPLLIQPFVENAIWHGLMHKTSKGMLSVNIAKEDRFLVISIEDNGIGREASAKINSGKTKHKSLGMSITRERLEIMNLLSQSKGGFEIIDLKDPDGNAVGTRVVIRLLAY